MNWDDVKNKKEDSIRESTKNPMSKPFKINGKTYNSYTEWSNSDEYKEFLKAEEEAELLYKQKAKEYFDSLETDKQLLLFFHITNQIFEHYFHDNGSYRGLLYNKLNFEPDAYTLGIDSGMFAIHNSLYTPMEIEENISAIIKHFNLDLSTEARETFKNIFIYGYDNSSKLKDMLSGQQAFEFEKPT